MSAQDLVTVTLPDGSRRSYPAGVSYADVAKDIGPGLFKAALAVKADGVLMDVTRVIERDAGIEFVTSRTDAGVDILRHSTAHVLAMAVQKLWPGTQVTIGPVIENGFYYDFAFPEGVKLSDADLPKIEEAMRAIGKADHAVTREVVERAQVIEIFQSLGEHFKVEIIKGLPADDVITVYKMGGWFDLCVGPHMPRTGMLGAFKLTSVAGSYWRGDEHGPRLTRIYGTAWANQKDLDEYLARIEEAKRRDHRLLGKQLGLFSFHLEAPAHPFFHPKGQLVLNILRAYVRRSNRKFGLKEVAAPLVLNVDLWKRSGHYDNYAENMYFTKVDETESAIKPMNCPGHCLIFSTERHSYRELPIRYSEFGRCHRHERSGVTHGLFRVRSFTQDDGHIFCSDDQIQGEVLRLIEQTKEIYRGIGFPDFRTKLATRPEKSLGTAETWEKAERVLAGALDAGGVTFEMAPGEGAFYGPKIEFHLIDSLGRSWQCGTVQLDFSMPARFGLEFIGNDDKPHTPAMLHRAILGSFERFLGILIEHTGGHFPLWLAPEQVRVLTITEAHREYARGVVRELSEAGIRVELDDRGEKLGYKIREAQLQKVPYMVVLGDKEMESTTVSPRYRDGTTIEGLTTGKFIQKIISECGPHWGIGV